MFMNIDKSMIILSIVAIFVFGLLAGIFVMGVTMTNIPGGEPVRVAPIRSGCTKELKICPDGTSVGRTEPNCKFATCPLPPAPAEVQVPPTVEEERVGSSGGCTLEAMECPNGKIAGRSGPNCEFVCE